MYLDIGTFPTTRAQHERFKSGALWRDWAARYPELFDSDDCRQAETQAHRGYHFHEWLAALLVYQSTGYLSLIKKYEYAVHKRKRDVLKRLVSPETLAAISGVTKSKKAQCPDLLCYAPDFSDWFFCEVKGPRDVIRQVQTKYFEELVDSSQKPVRLLSFRRLR